MLNEWDKALHDKIHTSMLMEDPKNLLKNRRLQILNFLGSNYKIHGVVADIGCGNGYFGIGLAKKFPNLLRIDCIEASKAAVEQVIPRNINFYNMNKIVKAVHSTFDDLGSEKYDVIFSMGALHHSSNLRKTLNSVKKALKPGGLFIGQEPAMPDNTTHENYMFKYDIVEEKFGLKIRNGDRFDRFFRECEYKYMLIINGFDISLWSDFQKIIDPLKFKSIKNYLIANGFKKTFTKVLNSIFKTKTRINKSNFKQWENDMNKACKNVASKFFIAKKSKCKKTFHDS